MYPIGSRLCTLDGVKLGNGIIFDHEGGTLYRIESDFGNRYLMTHQEVDDHFSVIVGTYSDLEEWYRDRDCLRWEQQQ